MHKNSLKIMKITFLILLSLMKLRKKTCYLSKFSKEIAKKTA